MGGPNRRVLVFGAVGAVVVLGILLSLVGVGDVVESLSEADRTLVAATFGIAAGWLLAWSLLFRAVLASLGVRASVRRAATVYVGALFANNVTPFAQAGGEPVAALLISEGTDTRYETGLAAVASVDVINVVSSVSLIFLGVGYYATTATVDERLETAVGAATVLVAALVALVALVWRRRDAIVERLPARVAPVASRLTAGRFDPGSIEAALSDRLAGFFEDIGRVATDRRRLATAVSFSLCGWLLQAAALGVAFAAVGHAVPPYVLVFVVPLANLAGATPLPGGLGGIEAAFVALLVPTTGVAAAAITAAVLVFRGAVYWMPVAVGGTVASAYGVRALR